MKLTIQIKENKTNKPTYLRKELDGHSICSCDPPFTTLSIHVSVHQLPDLSFPPSFPCLCVCLAFDFLLSTHDYMPCRVLLFTLEMPGSRPPGGVQKQVESTCSLASQDSLVFHGHSKEHVWLSAVLAKHLLDVFSLFFLQPKVWLECSQ